MNSYLLFQTETFLRGLCVFLTNMFLYQDVYNVSGATASWGSI